MVHTELTPELGEHITLYALQVLDDATARAFTTHVETCALCRQELQAHLSTLGFLGLVPPAMLPPRTLKARLMAQVHVTTPAPSLLPPALLRSYAAFLAWEPSTSPGVSFHWLRRDTVTGTVVALVKIQPGSRYVMHRHVGGEDCLVLQGGFRDSRGEYRTGAFVYYEPGSVHQDFQALAEEECLLFVVAHGGLELLPA